jgi:hypothetical protein
MDGNVGRSLNPDPNSVAANINYRNDNIIADINALITVSGQD